MGIHLTLEAFTQFWSSAWDRYVDVVSTMPVDWPMPYLAAGGAPAARRLFRFR